MAKFRKGSYVRLTHDAQEAYQAYPWVDQVLVVTRVTTKYMPAAEFFQKGSPNGYSPGYDEDVGGALYDVRTAAGDDVASAFYEWELIKAEAMKIEKQVSVEQDLHGALTEVHDAAADYIGLADYPRYKDVCSYCRQEGQKPHTDTCLYVLAKQRLQTVLAKNRPITFQITVPRSSENANGD